MTKRMSLEEVQQTREYKRLTPKQQLYVSTYIATGLLGHYDDDAAVRAAYECKTAQSFHTLKYTMRENPRILDVLHLHFGKDAADVFLEDINRAIRNRKLTLAQVQAMYLKAQMMGLGSALKETAYPKEKKSAKKSAKNPSGSDAQISPSNLEPPAQKLTKNW